MSRRKSRNENGAPRRPAQPSPERPAPAVKPPRPNRLLLGAAAVLLIAWLAFLVVLALLARP